MMSENKKTQDLFLAVLVSTWQAIRATRTARRKAAAHRQADQAAQVTHSQTLRAETETQKPQTSAFAARAQPWF
jgi:hypothetical protein